MRAGMIALVVTGALASTSANAIVTFSSQYLVGPTVTGNTGVGVGDVLSVEAFYDPLHATLAYQDSVFTIHNFDAQYAGLRITVGDLVWQTTGPLSISTTVERRDGNVVATSIGFLGSTNPSYQGAVATTLSTPWNIIGNASIGFNPRFETSGEVTGPRLFDENDIGSILLPVARYYMGGAYAATSSGQVHFNFNDPAALGLPPVPSVPEPGPLGLFALGGAGLLFRRARAKRKN